jgi:hypothetical protein
MLQNGHWPTGCLAKLSIFHFSTDLSIEHMNHLLQVFRFVNAWIFLDRSSSHMAETHGLSFS